LPRACFASKGSVGSSPLVSIASVLRDRQLGLDNGERVGDHGGVSLLDRWFDRWLDRDRWFIRNLVLLVDVVVAYFIFTSFVLWPPAGVLRDDLAGHLSGGLDAAFYWLTSMGPLGLVVLAILWRGRDRWAHPRRLALLLGFLTNAPWIAFAIASVLDGENAYFLVDAIAPALLFGALMWLPARPGAESPPQPKGWASDLSL
jgi:hypothetical protein